MLVVGALPSGGVAWLALSRIRLVVTRAPDWALPCSGSPPSPPLPKLSTWRFHAVSVKPRLYEKSCMRLCIACRLASAASMSFRCGLSKTPGAHRWAYHWLVQGYLYSRSGRGVAKPFMLKPVPVALLHASAAHSLLPRVV